MAMTEKIRILMIKRNITQKELAEKLGVTQQNISKKFKLDNWRESDLEEIAKICDCKYEGIFKSGLNDDDNWTI
ncbi:MAG: helix-turn-helix transcriptional regulator [Candidatus Gastranaerophilaceae bacterium]